MSVEKIIAQSFASSHPDEAARVLETLPEEALEEVLDVCETRTAAAVVEALMPAVAARCLSRQTPARAAGIVNDLSLERSADLLRRLGDEERAGILAGVPEERRRPLEKLLRFPEHLAGAMMEPRVESYPESMTVDAALRELRRPGRELRYYLYVVDDNLTLTGVTSLRELVAAPPEATLRSVMTRSVQTLSARAGRKAILDHPGWQHHPVLPVVDEVGRLVGVFRYETFRGMQQHPETSDASPLDVVLALGELFWLGASGVLRGLEEPPSEPSKEEE